ncbi:MAG: box helicase [Paenibacillaceae bacterium]|jgi:superfamily II DNA/RNA helicase|nr:box helicase [Paenibacillaceae bacterium]
MNGGFHALGIGEPWLGKLAAAGIVEPTSVQAEAIPAVLRGADVIAQSQTGTGKTLAYLLPILQRLDSKEKAVQAAVIVPTRELGMQIVRVAEQLMDGTGLRVQPLIGGAALGRQVEKLKLHPQLVVGTPGRMMELVKVRKLGMHGVRTMVVDEVDQVLDLGSLHEVEALLKGSKQDRQVLFFSATVPDEVAQTAERWMNEPVRIAVDPGQRTAKSLAHWYVVCEERDKIDTLRRIVRSVNPRSAIVFTNEVDRLAEVVSKLKYADLSIEALYSEAGKQERANVMKSFRDGRFQLLLATDVAARGLDIEGVSLVVNLDLPIDADHYVHRAGRTGRMGRPGTVISIAGPRQKFIIDKFAKALSIVFEPKALFRGGIVDPAQDRSADARRRRQAEAARERERVQVHAAAPGSASSGGRVGTGTKGETDRKGATSGATNYGAKAGRPNPAKAAGGDRLRPPGTGKKAAAASGGNAGRKSRRDKTPEERKNIGAPRWLKSKPPR